MRHLQHDVFVIGLLGHRVDFGVPDLGGKCGLSFYMLARITSGCDAATIYGLPFNMLALITSGVFKYGVGGGADQGREPRLALCDFGHLDLKLPVV